MDEARLKNILKELVYEYGCTGLKVSFEDEGATRSEVNFLRKITKEAGILLNLKVGGCEARTDIKDGYDIGVDGIVAPMIESRFALDKFLDATKDLSVNRGINIESEQGVKYFTSPKNVQPSNHYKQAIDYIVFGRHDYVNSICKSKDYVDDKLVLKEVKKLFSLISNNWSSNIDFIVGGAISAKSYDFLSKLYSRNLLSKFETRYVIFDCNVTLVSKEKFEDALIKALKFEICYLEGDIKNVSRVEMLKKLLLEFEST